MEILDELRVRRLTVVDEHGVERVVAEVKRGAAELRVELPGEAIVTLVAASDLHLGPIAGLHLSADGDSVAELLTFREDGQWKVTVSGLSERARVGAGSRLREWHSPDGQADNQEAGC